MHCGGYRLGVCLAAAASRHEGKLAREIKGSPGDRHDKWATACGLVAAVRRVGRYAEGLAWPAVAAHFTAGFSGCGVSSRPLPSSGSRAAPWSHVESAKVHVRGVRCESTRLPLVRAEHLPGTPKPMCILAYGGQDVGQPASLVVVRQGKSGMVRVRRQTSFFIASAGISFLRGTVRTAISAGG